MTETNKRLLELVLQEKTLNEISNEMKLSQKQIYSRLVSLRRSGYNFKRNFYYDGEQSFKLIKGIVNNHDNNETTILTTKEDNHFKALLISDLHFGSVLEKVDALNKIYDYCIKEGINIILNAGDFIDGTFGGIKKTYDIELQIKEALKNHPYDKNILNFICLGNHDVSSKIDYGIDFSDVLSNKRPDLIPIGYGNGIINVKNDQIILKHQVGYGVQDIITKNKLVLRGHSHETRISENGSNINVYLPSLSGVVMKEDLIYPCAFKMELAFNHGCFSYGIFNQLLVDSKVFILNELKYELSRGKSIMLNEPILNEIDTSKRKVLSK